MGLRELLILVLILAIIGVVLRGLYLALRPRRGRIKIALEKNVPDYDLEELELRELPSGGARLVERSFAQAMKQSSEQNAREAGARAGMSKSPSRSSAPKPTKPVAAAVASAMSTSRVSSQADSDRPAGTGKAQVDDADIPVLTEKVEENIPDIPVAPDQNDVPERRSSDISDQASEPASADAEAVEPPAESQSEPPSESQSEPSIGSPVDVPDEPPTELPVEPVIEQIPDDEFPADELPAFNDWTYEVREEPALDPEQEPESTSEAAPAQVQAPEPEPEPEIRPTTEADEQERATQWADDRDSLDAQVFVDDYASEDDEDYDDDDYGDDFGEEDDEDEFDDELEDAMTRSSWLDEPAEEPDEKSAADEASDRDLPDSELTESESLEEMIEEPLDGPGNQSLKETAPVRPVGEAVASSSDDAYEESDELSGSQENGFDEIEEFDDRNEFDESKEHMSEQHFGPATDDDFDVLLDGYEDERNERLEQLEAQQESASRKFAAWAGQKMGSLSSGAGSLLRASRDKRAHAVEGSDEKRAAKRARLQAAADREQAQRDSADAQSAVAQQNELDLGLPEPELDPGRTRPSRAASTHDAQVAHGGRTDVPGESTVTGTETGSNTGTDTGTAGASVAAATSASGQTPEDQAAEVNNNVDQEYSEVLVVNVMARDGTMIDGDELLPVLLSAGLRFGEMSIFHRHAKGKTGPVLFSVANILNPGTFDLNTISDFSTRGLCFFLTLPNVINNMQAFDEMLRTAQYVCDGLDAELKDDYRSVMTAQTIEHYRERVQNFELRQLRAGR